MNKPRLLVISHVLPFPRNAGQKQRIYYTLRAARERFHVAFASFAAAGEEKQRRDRLLQHCDDVVLLPARYVRSTAWKAWHQTIGKCV